jgi:hypothetical protein
MVAVCIWRGALWVAGSGEYATLAHCPPGLTVILHRSLGVALNALAAIDRTGCGHACERDHELVILHVEALP